MQKLNFLFFTFFLVLTLSLNSFSLVHAQDFSDCTIYGNCQPIVSLVGNYTGLNVNNSMYLQGLTPAQVAALYVDTDNDTGLIINWSGFFSSQLWSTSAGKLYPTNLSAIVGVGTSNPDSGYEMEIKNDQHIAHNNNTVLAISSGEGNTNASIYFREDNVVRIAIKYVARTVDPVFQIYSFLTDTPLFEIDVKGNTWIANNLTVEKNTFSPNLCYSNGSQCSIGITATIITAQLTLTGSQGNMTFKNGLLTAQTQAT